MGYGFFRESTRSAGRAYISFCNWLVGIVFGFEQRCKRIGSKLNTSEKELQDLRLGILLASTIIHTLALSVSPTNRCDPLNASYSAKANRGVSCTSAQIESYRTVNFKLLRCISAAHINARKSWRNVQNLPGRFRARNQNHGIFPSGCIHIVQVWDESPSA